MPVFRGGTKKHMKLSIGNKLLMLLHWLCSLMICVAFTLCLVVPGLQANLVSRAEGSLGVVGAKIAGGVALALYLALSVATLLILIRRKKRVERGFITVGPDDKGKVRISVSAVEQMVRQSVRTIDGITDMRVNIEGLDDAIGITIDAVIASGAHVPTITANMQRAITQFVEVNCGVAVQSVAITINAVSGKGESARRRLIGRGKPQAEAPAPARVPEPAVDDAFEPGLTPASDAAGAQSATGIGQDSAAASEDMAGVEAPAYDSDKPYESEFAKDYAAMKARESAGQTEAAEADSTED